MDYLAPLIVCGLATAFVMSVLEYFTQNPLIRAVSAVLTSVGSTLLMTGWQVQAIPMSLGATFLGVLLISLVSSGTDGAKVTAPRVPRL